MLSYDWHSVGLLLLWLLAVHAQTIEAGMISAPVRVDLDRHFFRLHLPPGTTSFVFLFPARIAPMWLLT